MMEEKKYSDEEVSEGDMRIVSLADHYLLHIHSVLISGTLLIDKDTEKEELIEMWDFILSMIDKAETELITNPNEVGN